MKFLITIFLFISLDVFALSLDTDRDGMPDKYEVKNGLDKEQNDAGEDLDKDGFTNYEEYYAQTDPQSPKSHPDLAKALTIKKIIIERFPLKFSKLDKKGDKKKDWLIHIFINYNPVIKKLGDIVIVGDTKYNINDVIYRIEERFNKKLGRPVDTNVSEIVFKNEIDKHDEFKAIIEKDVYKKPKVLLVDRFQNEFIKTCNDEITIGNKRIGIEKYKIIGIYPTDNWIKVRSDSGKEYKIKMAQPEDSANSAAASPADL